MNGMGTGPDGWPMIGVGGRRVRTKDRIVKRAISKYNARGPVIDRATYKATISINMLTTDP
ncbi:hypothetical protein AB0A71_39775 [Kitasatospora aureofaciens]|uniref:hypothetical protein n=1 Tax=Kitasatospora aureofaciens TaxID=1894 RepID=UPI0033E19FA8